MAGGRNGTSRWWLPFTGSVTVQQWKDLRLHIRVAADDLKIAIPEVRFGLSPDMGGTVRLTQLVGLARQKGYPGL
jgi:hypothetical protein